VKVLVWGAIWHNFKSELHIIPANVTIDGTHHFEDIVLGCFIDQADAVYPHYDWILQPDNARPHVRRDVLDSLACLEVNVLPDWPPYSPDLNIIERVWAIMKGMVAFRDPKNPQELCDPIEQVWADLKRETIDASAAETPRRLIAVIRREGRTIQTV
jgi:hypothetical protein